MNDSTYTLTHNGKALVTFEYRPSIHTIAYIISGASPDAAKELRALADQPITWHGAPRAMEALELFRLNDRPIVIGGGATNAARINPGLAVIEVDAAQEADADLETLKLDLINAIMTWAETASGVDSETVTGIIHRLTGKGGDYVIKNESW